MRRPICFLLAMLCLAGSAPDVHAQFWKRKKKKAKIEEPKKEKKAVKPAVKREKINYPPTVKKDRYRVDVLLPLYLDELVKNNKATFKDRVPDKAAAGTYFYQGLKLAVDTIDKNEYRMDVYVHDITSSELNAAKLVEQGLLDSTDLIIGAVTSADIPGLAQFAKKKQINFISVLSPSDAGVKDNAYFTLMQPSLRTHCEWLGNMIGKKYGIGKAVIYHRGSVGVDEQAYKYITGDHPGVYTEVNSNEPPLKSELRDVFDSTVTNVIVMPVIDVAYAESLIQQLKDGFPSYRFEIYGMPSWKSMPALKKADPSSNISVNITSPVYFDPSTATGLSICDHYKTEFGGKPGDWVFQGYETFMMYAYLLKNYGTIFNQRMKDNNGSIFTKYEIIPRWTKDHDLLYNENRNVYLYRYQGGNLMVEQ